MHEEELKLSEVQYRLLSTPAETPPQVPMITGSTPRRQTSQKKDFEERINSTAAAVLKAVSQDSPSSVVQSLQVNQAITEGTTP